MFFVLGGVGRVCLPGLLFVHLIPKFGALLLPAALRWVVPGTLLLLLFIGRLRILGAIGFGLFLLALVFLVPIFLAVARLLLLFLLFQYFFYKFQVLFGQFVLGINGQGRFVVTDGFFCMALPEFGVAQIVKRFLFQPCVFGLQYLPVVLGGGLEIAGFIVGIGHIVKHLGLVRGFELGVGEVLEGLFEIFLFIGGNALAGVVGIGR